VPFSLARRPLFCPIISVLLARIRIHLTTLPRPLFKPVTPHISTCTILPTIMILIPLTAPPQVPSTHLPTPVSQPQLTLAIMLTVPTLPATPLRVLFMDLPMLTPYLRLMAILPILVVQPQAWLMRLPTLMSCVKPILALMVPPLLAVLPRALFMGRLTLTSQQLML
jgi:hypothetical protein